VHAGYRFAASLCIDNMNCLMCFGAVFDPPIGVQMDPPLDLQFTISVPDFDE
jgi:hypothetical protein